MWLVEITETPLFSETASAWDLQQVSLYRKAVSLWHYHPVVYKYYHSAGYMGSYKIIAFI